MRRFSIAFLALSAVLAPLVSTVAQESASMAVPLEPIKDFEIVPKGEWIHHDFEIKNEGTGPLTIFDVKPSCGCTVAEFDQVIQPGEVGLVKAKLDTSGFAGPISKPISVFTNDTGNPKLQLVIKANVKPYLAVRPGYARFIYVQGEPLSAISQLLWTEDGTDIDVVSVKTPYDHLTVKHRVASEAERNDQYPGKQWVFDVHLDPNAPVGALRDYVEVELSHAKQKTVRIPISGFVRPRQHVTPQKIDFGVLAGDNLPLKHIATFTNFITQGIEVTKTETSLEGVSIEVNEVGRRDGHRFELIVTISPDTPKGEFESILKLHITDEQNPVVEVPISGKIL